MVCFGLVPPSRHRVSASIDVLAEFAAEIAHDRAQPGADLEATEQLPEPGVRPLEQVAAHVGEEVLVAGQHGDIAAQLVDEGADGRRHGPSEVPDHSHGRPEGVGHLAQTGQDGVRVLGGDLPRAQHPAAPAGIGDQQGAAAVLAGGLDR